MSDDNFFMKPYIRFRLRELSGRAQSQGVISIGCDEMFDMAGGAKDGIILQGSMEGPEVCRVLITPEILADLKQYVAWIEKYMESGKPFTDRSEIEGSAEH